MRFFVVDLVQIFLYRFSHILPTNYLFSPAIETAAEMLFPFSIVPSHTYQKQSTLYALILFSRFPFRDLKIKQN